MKTVFKTFAIFSLLILAACSSVTKDIQIETQSDPKVARIWTIIAVIGDVFRSKDLSGAAKALSVLLIIIIPWLGVLGYILVRGGHGRAQNTSSC